MNRDIENENAAALQRYINAFQSAPAMLRQLDKGAHPSMLIFFSSEEAVVRFSASRRTGELTASTDRGSAVIGTAEEASQVLRDMQTMTEEIAAPPPTRNEERTVTGARSWYQHMDVPFTPQNDWCEITFDLATPGLAERLDALTAKRETPPRVSEPNAINIPEALEEHRADFQERYDREAPARANARDTRGKELVEAAQRLAKSDMSPAEKRKLLMDFADALGTPLPQHMLPQRSRPRIAQER